MGSWARGVNRRCRKICLCTRIAPIIDLQVRLQANVSWTDKPLGKPLPFPELAAAFGAARAFAFHGLQHQGSSTHGTTSDLR